MEHYIYRNFNCTIFSILLLFKVQISSTNTPKVNSFLWVGEKGSCTYNSTCKSIASYDLIFSFMLWYGWTGFWTEWLEHAPDFIYSFLLYECNCDISLVPNIWNWPDLLSTFIVRFSNSVKVKHIKYPTLIQTTESDMAWISRNLPIKLLHNIMWNISPQWYRQTFTKLLLLFCHLGSVFTKWRPHHLSLFYYWSILAFENGQWMGCILSCEIRI